MSMNVSPERVHATVMKLISDNYSLTAVDWPWVDFDTEAQNEWIAPHVIAHINKPARAGAKNCDILVDINCFGRLSSVSPHRVLTIAQTVADIFEQVSTLMLDGTEYIRFIEPELTTITQTKAQLELSRLAQVHVAIVGRIIGG